MAYISRYINGLDSQGESEDDSSTGEDFDWASELSLLDESESDSEGSTDTEDSDNESYQVAPTQRAQIPYM